MQKNVLNIYEASLFNQYICLIDLLIQMYNCIANFIVVELILSSVKLHETAVTIREKNSFLPINFIRSQRTQNSRQSQRIEFSFPH